MKKLILLFLIYYSLNIKITAQNITPDPWTDYCGWHYGNTPEWGGWVRDYIRNHTGYDLISFEGEELSLDTSKLETLYSTLSEVDPSIDILQLDGGLGQAKDTTKARKFIEMIQSDYAALWKDVIYQQSLKLTQLPNSEERVYYQLGNEIGSEALSAAIHYAIGHGYNGSEYDKSIIPVFADFYLAPTIEAIEKASLDAYGESGRIKIALGSINNAYNGPAKSFTDSLLNYSINNIYTETLEGSKVKDYIDIITVHYMVGNLSSNQWEFKLDSYLDYIGEGRIKGVWSTEEIGINRALSGFGTSTGTHATMRYLHKAVENNYNSNVVRTNYYGWNTGPVGTTLQTINQELFDFFGKTKLQALNPGIGYDDPINQGEEIYAFSTENRKKAIIVSLTSWSNLYQLSKEEWPSISNIEAIKYTTENNFVISTSLTENTTHYDLRIYESDFSDPGIILFKIEFDESTFTAYKISNSIQISPNPVLNQLHIATEEIIKDILVKEASSSSSSSSNSFYSFIINIFPLHFPLCLTLFIFK